MGKEEQDAILFSIGERRKAAQRKLVALNDKAEGLGREYERLGRILKEDPGAVCFEGCQPLPGRGVHAFNPAQFRIGEVALLMKEIHETETEIETCRRKLEDAGLS